MESIISQPPSAIAQHLREDERLVDQGKPCSLLVYQVPRSNTRDALAIACYLVPSADLGNDTKRLLYESILSKIKNHLEGGVQAQATPKPEEDGRIHRSEDAITPADLSSALKVLRNLQNMGSLCGETTVDDAISAIHSKILTNSPSTPASGDQQSQTTSPQRLYEPSWNATLSAYLNTHPAPPPARSLGKRHCYICMLAVQTPHPQYPCLCVPCGAFNLAGARFSQPPSLRLPATAVALVTGARLHLGYATARRLLRAGATVIATSRYPRDAAQRYAAEPDFDAWRGRLRVVGADFRSARDAFALVREVKRLLREWAAPGAEPSVDGGARLGILINNAAQTLTDSVRKEERAAEREDDLKRADRDGPSGGVLVEGGYQARVRGGAPMLSLEGVERERIGYENADEAPRDVALRDAETEKSLQTYTKSSWVQSLSEIPYDDVISAHAVNTFVPLILCRELLPLMGHLRNEVDVGKGQPGKPSKPLGYIVNVSSREGVFEATAAHTAKNGKHVHTNMSKAALNMITETEAGVTWKTRRVAMNTVDPGYMSAAPEYENAYDGLRPIGWEDGAGRVLWPIAMGEKEGEAVWGRFLKHYGLVHVDPGTGRG